MVICRDSTLVLPVLTPERCFYHSTWYINKIDYGGISKQDFGGYSYELVGK